ncbi:MAG: FAD:protein FMN transferase [Sphingobium sp.]|uniref:FAD:protein FMN transferase n=1 Tax=Sphingobium sp. TaxID=1912891 RepID=UPI0029BC3D05|nr:FAD:protein FMN transferase [Sphingobium sp.]MDX3910418.1 FAD:protein FMN transferase [Sphingobium sp.]
MGTSWSASIVAPPEGSDRAIRVVLDSVIASMSNWEAESAISRFNQMPVGQWMDLPDDLLFVLSAGLDIAARSRGAFDPAIGRLVDHWGFGPPPWGPSSSPRHDGQSWRAIEVAERRARRMADVALDLSGIAKGYAVDAVADRLRAMGCRHFLIEIGGELRGEGVRPDGQPFWVDLESPPGLAALPVMRIALCGLSVATSGDYRRFREEDGRRLSHSIDPAINSPIDNGVASVSVLHSSAMLADAWATAFGVLGPLAGMQLAAREGLAVLMIVREGDGAREYMTPALSAMLG